MDSSYSLRIPVKEIPNKKKTRKRKIITRYKQAHLSSHKYKCYQCSAEVYFLPGHELVCATCASRIVEKINLHPKKREIAAR
jgi:DNA-directed RNA polymerase subunit RPC12/RpoP